MIAAIALALTAPAQEQTTAATRMENLSVVEMFSLADRARAANRIDDAIGFYDALMHDPNPDIRAEARFRKGMMLANARRYREAAVAFRSVLDEKPDAARARLELARMLAAIGDERAARRELRQVQASGLPSDVAATVGQFDQILRSRKRVGGSFEVALAPDSNINRATQARLLDTIIAPVTLSDDARANPRWDCMPPARFTPVSRFRTRSRWFRALRDWRTCTASPNSTISQRPLSSVWNGGASRTASAHRWDGRGDGMATNFTREPMLRRSTGCMLLESVRNLSSPPASAALIICKTISKTGRSRIWAFRSSERCHHGWGAASVFP